MKRKSLIYLVVLSVFCVTLVTIGGCKTFGEKVETMVCNPPQTVRDLVRLAESAILIGLGLPPSPENEATIYAIEAGVCVSVTQLNNLIAWIQSYNTKAVKATVKTKAAIPLINVQPLVEWRKTVK